MIANTTASFPSRRASLFSLRGRLGRIEFIAYSVGFAVVATLISSAIGYFLLIFPAAMARNWYSILAMLVVNLLLPLTISIFAVKRLHDIGKPGWLAVFLLVPMANFLFALFLWVWPGDAGANAFGNAPDRVSTPVLAAAVAFPLLLVAGFMSSGPLGDIPLDASRPATMTVPDSPTSDTLRPYPP